MPSRSMSRWRAATFPSQTSRVRARGRQE
jgi:hypothetical protein